VFFIVFMGDDNLQATTRLADDVAGANRTRGAYGATITWIADRAFIFGGSSSSNSSATYDPTLDSWKVTAVTPLAARFEHAATWTGTHIMVWARNEVALYDPTADSWKKVSAGPLVARYSPCVLWLPAVSRVIVWGGMSTTTTPTLLDDGAAYDPATDTWLALPTAPIAGRFGAFCGVTNGRLIIWGGEQIGTWTWDGALYDPATRLWTKVSPPTASKPRGRYSAGIVNDALIVTLGVEGSYPDGLVTTGWKFLGAWSSIAPLTEAIVSPAPRERASSWTGAGQLGVFSGWSTAYAKPKNGAMYDPAKDSWSALDATGAPDGRAGAPAVWTGKSALVWGGGTSTGERDDGAIYTP